MKEGREKKKQEKMKEKEMKEKDEKTLTRDDVKGILDEYIKMNREERERE